jgi:hypothetical protein
VVRSATAAELVGDTAQLLGLDRGELASRDLAADHLDPGLALSVDSVFETERTEIVVRYFTGQERLRFRTEYFDFFPHGFIMIAFKHFPPGKALVDEGCHNPLASTRD